MMISFDVKPSELVLIDLAFARYGGKADRLIDVIEGAGSRVYELETALGEIAKAVDADPATYRGTTLAMIRDIAGKALGEPTEA